MARIHPTAVVDGDARLGDDVRVGPHAVIEAGAVVGDGCRIEAHAVIKGYCRLGTGTRVHEHAVLGGDPQHLAFRECTSYLELGDGNVVREGVTMHRSIYEGAATRIGDRNYFMAGCHVGHDCLIGNGVVLANAALLAGHVEVEDRAFVSGAVGVHQFCRIGTLAMVGHNSKINQDCLPFVITDGVPGRARGLNVVGLQRAELAKEERRQLKAAYRLLLRSGLPRERALQRLDDMDSPWVAHLSAFVRASRRGIAGT